MAQNRLDDFIDKYHNMYSERNDIKKIVVTPEYIENNREQVERAMRMFVLYPDYLIDIITPKDSYFRLFFIERQVYERHGERHGNGDVAGEQVHAASRTRP